MVDFWCNLFLTPGVATPGEMLVMKVVIMLATFCMIIGIFIRGFADRCLFESDRYWNNICGTLVERIDKLMPTHHRHMRIYAKATQMVLRRKPMLDLMRSLPSDVKVEAERDVCLTDVYDEKAVAMLKIQFLGILEQQSKAGT